jgi:predicted CoA-binding protein
VSTRFCPNPEAGGAKDAGVLDFARVRIGSQCFFAMKSVAILGASNDPAKFGNKAVRAFQQLRFQVYPINPREPEVEGLPAYPTIDDVPVRPDLVSVYVPPRVLLTLLPSIATKGCDELWLNPGTESPEVLAEAARLDLNVIQACSIVGHGISPSAL